MHGSYEMAERRSNQGRWGVVREIIFVFEQRFGSAACDGAVDTPEPSERMCATGTVSFTGREYSRGLERVDVTPLACPKQYFEARWHDWPVLTNECLLGRSYPGRHYDGEGTSGVDLRRRTTCSTSAL